MAQHFLKECYLTAACVARALLPASVQRLKACGQECPRHPNNTYPGNLISVTTVKIRPVFVLAYRAGTFFPGNGVPDPDLPNQMQ